MGNSENWVTTDASFPSEHQLLTNLIPIEDAESSNAMLGLGRFKIYRFRTEPYEIVMKHVRTFTPHHPKFQEYEEAARMIAGRLDHKNISKIHSVNICKRSSICTEQLSIESYVNYYALDLQNVIDQRRSMDNRFTAGQLWYIVNSLVDLSLYLQKFEIYYGIYTPSNICLSPEGYIKVYLHHCTPKNNHSLYNHLIGNDTRDIHKFLPLPPECLPFLKKRAMSINELDQEKMDVFGIGAIALEAMVYNPTRRYYLHQSDSELALTFDEHQLQLDFNELRQVYPSNLVSLIEAMTALDPKGRLSLLQAQKYIKSVREHISINGSIQLIEDEQDKSIPKFSFKRASRDCREVLRSITSRENKLQFCPLKTVSKDKYSSCKSHYQPLKMSQASRKENKLQLSSLTIARTLSRRKPGKGEGRLLSSFR